MIWLIVFAIISVWFLSELVRMLWVAKTKGYVMALTNPFEDSVETPQTREDNPQKFWANVICCVALLPLAASGVWLSFSELWTAFQLQGK